MSNISLLPVVRAMISGVTPRIVSNSNWSLYVTLNLLCSSLSAPSTYRVLSTQTDMVTAELCISDIFSRCLCKMLNMVDNPSSNTNEKSRGRTVINICFYLKISTGTSIGCSVLAFMTDPLASVFSSCYTNNGICLFSSGLMVFGWMTCAPLYANSTAS